MNTTAVDKELAEIDRALAQQPAAQTVVVQAAEPEGSVPAWWSNQNSMTMSSVVLIFGVVVIAICAALMRSSRPSPEAILRVFGTVLIITGALFLVVAGYTDKQMAPVMGLLGTLAGYLLGKGGSDEPPSAGPKG